MSVQDDLLNDEKYSLNQSSIEAPETTQVCSFWQDETEEMCSSWQNGARRVRGENTENSIIELDGRMDNCQEKRHVIMKFVHDEKHVIFNLVKGGRRKKG